MNKWENFPCWLKELCGLLVSGTIIVLLLFVVLSHLQEKNKSESASSVITSPPNMTRRIFLYEDSEKTTVGAYPPVDAAAALGPFLDKLGWLDIVILVFIWPISMIFRRFSKEFTAHVYKRML